MLGALTNLDFLQLSNTKLDDVTLKLLTDNLLLKVLGLANTLVTSAGAYYLARNSHLEGIFAEDVSWSHEVCALLLNMPSLKDAELNIDGVTHDYLELVCPETVCLHP